jgi:hypothetical protein
MSPLGSREFILSLPAALGPAPTPRPGYTYTRFTRALMLHRML